MAQPFKDLSPRTLRISYVWLVGAVLTLRWAILDWLATDLIPPAAVVSAITGFLMGLALFYDTKREVEEDVDVFDPGQKDNG